jgi:DNA polymerase
VTTEKKRALRRILAYYREIGFEYLPLQAGLSSSDSHIEDTVSAATASSYHEHEYSSDGDLDRNNNEFESKVAALKALQDEIGMCTRCKLSQGRNSIVFGEGNSDADLMFIGEAPGREEDAQGRPFVGEAGQHLTRLIQKLGFQRESVYIANICKCRPPENRDPEADEMSVCFSFLRRQIEIISPKIIISLGKIATYRLMQPSVPIAKFSILKMRGRWFHYQNIPVMPTTHPAYWLRNREDKHQVLKEAQEAVARLRELKGEA